MERYIIRPMTPADQDGKAYVHYRAWHETYPALMPASVLAAHTLESCLSVARQHPENTLAAVDCTGRIAGFISYVPQAQEFFSIPSASEISGLYVLKEYQRQGLGRRLLCSCLDLLPSSQTVLFILQGNDSAAAFYQRMGFRFTGHKISYPISGCPVTELEMLLEHTP